MYEEGAGLDEDEVEENRRHLSTVLASLPGGGLSHGSIASIQDNAQSLHVQVVITHQVMPTSGLPATSARPMNVYIPA